MTKDKTVVISSIILILGIVMLMGSSYSIISSNSITNEEYTFNVATFDVEFQDNRKITVNGLPISDIEGLKNSKEYTFEVNNNSNFDINYRLDIIDKSQYLMSNVIKYSYSINDSDYSDIYLLSDDYTLVQNRVLLRNSKDHYKIKFWIDYNADERYMNKTFSSSISLFATHNENKYATDVLEFLYNNKQDGVVKDSNNILRFKGEDPLNYVWFNCNSNYTKGEDYCEKWRIVGSYNNQEFKMIKLIGNYVDDISFGNDELNGNYDKSYINTYLNGAYYDSLNKQASELIWKNKWYIGSTKESNYNLAYQNELILTTDAYVGLLNVSDYLFIKDNNWIKSEKDIMLINKNGDNVNILRDNELTTIDSLKEVGIFPVVYLKPDVSIVSGDGSINNPYELLIKYPMNY